MCMFIVQPLSLSAKSMAISFLLCVIWVPVNWRHSSEVTYMSTWHTGGNGIVYHLFRSLLHIFFHFAVAIQIFLWWITEVWIFDSVFQFLRGDRETDHVWLCMNLSVNIWSWASDECYVIRDCRLIRKGWKIGIFGCEILNTSGGKIPVTFSNLPEFGTLCPLMPIM